MIFIKFKLIHNFRKFKLIKIPKFYNLSLNITKFHNSNKRMPKKVYVEVSCMIPITTKE